MREGVGTHKPGPAQRTAARHPICRQGRRQCGREGAGRRGRGCTAIWRQAATTRSARQGSTRATGLIAWSRGTGTPRAQSRPPTDYPVVARSRTRIGDLVKPCHSVHSVLPVRPGQHATCAARTGRRRLEGADATCRQGHVAAGDRRSQAWGRHGRRHGMPSVCRQGRRQHGGDKRRTCRGRGMQCHVDNAAAARPSKQGSA